MNEYKTYLETQQKKGITCPILYIQQENNVQGTDVFVIHPTDNKNEISNIIPTSVRNINIKDVSPYFNSSLTHSTSTIENFETAEITTVTDAGRLNPPYNANNYPSFDPQGLYIGKHTNLDEIHYSTEKEPVSDNPMDTNWGGIQHTEQSINNGKYEENNVYKTTYYTPVNGILSTNNTTQTGNTIPLNGKLSINNLKQMGNAFTESFQSFW
jgi:hypothetical protein